MNDQMTIKGKPGEEKGDIRSNYSFIWKKKNIPWEYTSY